MHQWCFRNIHVPLIHTHSVFEMNIPYILQLQINYFAKVFSESAYDRHNHENN